MVSRRSILYEIIQSTPLLSLIANPLLQTCLPFLKASDRPPERQATKPKRRLGRNRGFKVENRKCTVWNRIFLVLNRFRIT